MVTAQRYLDILSGLIKNLEGEEGAIDAAAEILAGAVRADRLIHVFGTDPYSASSSDEFFFKAGGLVNISPIYDPAFCFAHGASRCGMCQSLDGLSPVILDYYEYINAGDPMVVIGSDPKGIVFRQAVGKSRDMGLKTIVIVPLDSDGTTAPPEADVVINTRAPEKDAVLDVSGIKSGGVATALNSAVINMLVATTLEKLENPLAWSGNRLADCGRNEALIEKYISRVKHL